MTNDQMQVTADYLRTQGEALAEQLRTMTPTDTGATFNLKTKPAGQWICRPVSFYGKSTHPHFVLIFKGRPGIVTDNHGRAWTLKECPNDTADLPDGVRAQGAKVYSADRRIS